MDLIKHISIKKTEQTIVVGSFRQMVNTWLYYLNSDFKEGNNIKFFEYLNKRVFIPKYYRFDGICFNSNFYQNCFSFEHMVWLWKQAMKNYQNDWMLPLAKKSFFDGISKNRLPSIFDYLFNIWIEEIDNISYKYYNYYVYLETYKKVNFLQYLIMKLRGQIV